MAQQTIVGPSSPLAGPNQGIGTDGGTNWSTIVSMVNQMWTELYGRTGGSSSLAASGFAPNTIIPLQDFLAPTGAPMAASPAAGVFGISFTAGTSSGLTSETASTGTKTNVCVVPVTLPLNYIAGQNITLTINAQTTGAGTITAKTVNANAYAMTTAGVMGADLINVSAKSITNAAADYSFTISGAGLTPGQHFGVKITGVITTSAGSAALQINSVRLS
jgi:hypothetical protein